MYDGACWTTGNPEPGPSHNCDGIIGKHLKYAENGWPFPGKKKIYWTMVIVSELTGNPGKALAIPIRFCPVCGKELEMPDA